jgi:hypothetical protein
MLKKWLLWERTYLEELRFQLVGDHKTDLDAIKLHIENWKKYGKVPFPEDTLKVSSTRF